MVLVYFHNGVAYIFFMLVVVLLFPLPFSLCVGKVFGLFVILLPQRGA